MSRRGNPKTRRRERERERERALVEQVSQTLIGQLCVGARVRVHGTNEQGTIVKQYSDNWFGVALDEQPLVRSHSIHATSMELQLL